MVILMSSVPAVVLSTAALLSTYNKSPENGLTSASESERIVPVLSLSAESNKGSLEF